MTAPVSYPLSRFRSVKVYRETATHSASPGKLVLMLFDGALRFMSAAELGFEETDFCQRNEKINNNIVKALAIITELQSTLNLKVGGEFAATMFRLYDYMREQLRLANSNKDAAPIGIVQDLLGQIRGAWCQMLEEQDSPAITHGKLALTC